MTETTTRTLVAVRVSEDCTDKPPAGLGNGEFFAVKDGRDMHTLLVPQSDPRSRGMWAGSHYATQAGLDNPETYRAWTVFDSHITVLPENSSESPREVSTAKDLRKGDVFRISHDESTQYVVTGDLSASGTTIPIAWEDNTLDWAGPRVTVFVTLVPESDQTEWAKAKVREVSPDPVTAESGPEETVTLTVSELNARLESAKAEAKATADAVFNEWKESANATAIEYANDNSLCSEFDRCMRDIGMMDRDEWRETHTEEFTVEFTYSTTVSAYDSEEAIDRATEEFEMWRGDWSAESL